MEQKKISNYIEEASIIQNYIKEDPHIAENYINQNENNLFYKPLSPKSQNLID